MKIYTRVGDKGGTSLYDGSKVNKDDVIIDCIGNIDELNSEIGCIISHLSTIEERGDLDTYIQILTNIQSELFDMGALIAYPPFHSSVHHFQFSLPAVLLLPLRKLCQQGLHVIVRHRLQGIRRSCRDVHPYGKRPTVGFLLV